MASKFFALFDDIAALMDDVAAMSKFATKKTAGILADDLAVNAEKASGFVTSRELPVLWKISKGSLLNKVIILPAAFLLSAFLPQAIVPILLLGGVYLAYEGVEKVLEFFFHKNKGKGLVEKAKMTPEEAAAFERERIKSAVFIDFILSAEIVMIALSTVADQPLNIQIPVVTVVALVATVGVYGLVALLVRMDDFGFNLIKAGEAKGNKTKVSVGKALVKTLPVLIKTLTVMGTLAMILVGGGIYVHNIHFLHDIVHGLPTILGEFLMGIAVGLVAVVLMKLFRLVVPAKKAEAPH
jgi:predicted DNA repair protein MutK